MPFKNAEAITVKIRKCCDHLAALDDTLRQDGGITAAMRAVMDSLYEGGAQTVPQIARTKRVTRQHIQVLADKLAAAAIVSTRLNPDDRRSPLLALTRHGEALFKRIREREIEALTDLARALRDHDLDAALKMLDTLQTYLDTKLSTDRQR